MKPYVPRQVRMTSTAPSGKNTGAHIRGRQTVKM